MAAWLLGCITKADRLGKHPTGELSAASCAYCALQGRTSLSVCAVCCPWPRVWQPFVYAKDEHMLATHGLWGKVSLEKVDRHRRIFLTSTSLLVPNRQCGCGSEFPRADRQNDGFLACALPQCLSPALRLSPRYKTAALANPVTPPLLQPTISARCRVDLLSEFDHQSIYR